MAKKTKARSESAEALIEPGSQKISDQLISQRKKEIKPNQSQEIIEIALEKEPGQRIYLTIEVKK